MNSLYQRLKRITLITLSSLREKFHLYDSEAKLAADNQSFWNSDYTNSGLAQGAHWKGNGVFNDNQKWLKLGEEHLNLLINNSSATGLKFPIKKIVEWGCGGGANAVHLAPLTEKYIGIEITSESLTECKKQVMARGNNNFHPVLIDASEPKAILNENIANADLFLCTYVFELLPSPTYGITVLELANQMLKNEGIAFIQIRYNDGRKNLKSKNWGYKHHSSKMTSYTIEDFWEKSKDCGFEPVGIFLMPKQPIVSEECYAYYFLKKNRKLTA